MANLIATISGFIVPGIGQMLNRQLLHGGVILIFLIISIILAFMLLNLPWYGLAVIYLVFSAYSAIDAWIYSPRKDEIEDKKLMEFEEMQKNLQEKEEREKENLKDKLKMSLVNRYGQGNYEITQLTKKGDKWRAEIKVNEKHFEVNVSNEGILL